MPRFEPPCRITPDHDVSQFDCGNEDLNRFLKDHAFQKQQAKLSMTYVVTMVDSSQVVAYYTLAFKDIGSTDPPKSIGRGMPTVIPALLLARLAVDQTYQGMRLGSSLLRDVLVRASRVIDNGPAPIRCVVIDAKDEQAKAFYERFGAIASPSNSLRLFIGYKAILRLFEPNS